MKRPTEVVGGQQRPNEPEKREKNNVTDHRSCKNMLAVNVYIGVYTYSMYVHSTVVAAAAQCKYYQVVSIHIHTPRSASKLTSKSDDNRKTWTRIVPSNRIQIEWCWRWRPSQMAIMYAANWKHTFDGFSASFMYEPLRIRAVSASKIIIIIQARPGQRTRELVDNFACA